MAIQPNPYNEIQLGDSSSDTLGFYGATPVARTAAGALATLSTLTPMQTSPFGFSTSAQLNSVVDQLKAITAALVANGLLAAS